MNVTVGATSKAEAKEKANNVFSNLLDTCGHAPYSVDLELDEDSCKKIEVEDEDE